MPAEEFNNEVLGVLGEAQLRWPQVKIHQMTRLSNHVTAVQSVEGPFAANAYAKWASYVFGEVAKVAQVAQAIHGLDGEIWESRRCAAIAGAPRCGGGPARTMIISPLLTQADHRAQAAELAPTTRARRDRRGRRRALRARLSAA